MAPQVGLEPTTLRLTAISIPSVVDWMGLYLHEKYGREHSVPKTDTTPSKHVLPTKFTTALVPCAIVSRHNSLATGGIT
jgi:hypothetical protein